jgi:hypothetical protein
VVEGQRERGCHYQVALFGEALQHVPVAQVRGCTDNGTAQKVNEGPRRSALWGRSKQEIAVLFLPVSNHSGVLGILESRITGRRSRQRHRVEAGQAS